MPQTDYAIEYIIGQCLSERTGLLAYGYVDAEFTLNPQNPTNRSNGPLGPNFRSNDVQLTTIYTVLEKDIDIAKQQCQFGARLDMLYGTQAFSQVAYGLDDGFVADATSQFYKLSLTQLYGEVFIPTGGDSTGFEIQGGHFMTPVGYEATFLPGNFFLSQTYASSLQPGTHTGVNVGYHFGENFNIWGGVNAGWDTWEFYNNNGWGYTAQTQWNDDEGINMVYFALAGGPSPTDIPSLAQFSTIPLNSDHPAKYDFAFDYSLVYQRTMGRDGEGIYVAEHDLGFRDGDAELGNPDAMWYSFDQFLYYKFTEKLWGGVRFMWLGVAQGDLLGGTFPRTLLAEGNYYSFTMGININPNYNIRIRPELRWDWQNRDDPNAIPAYDDNTANHQFTAACDLIFLF